MPRDWLDPKEIRRTDRFTHYAVAAAKLAWEDAGTPEVAVGARRHRSSRPASAGSRRCCMQHLRAAREGPGPRVAVHGADADGERRGGTPRDALRPHRAQHCTVSACASSNHAIGEGMRLIRDGYLDLCIVGGSEAATHPAHGRGVRTDDGAHEEPRPRDRLPAVRRGPQRLRAVGGRARADPRVRGARAGARRADLLRGRRLRASDDAHHITAPDPKGSGAALAMRWALARRRRGARGGLLRQRARHLDPAERRGGDRRDQGGARRRASRTGSRSPRRSR